MVFNRRARFECRLPRLGLTDTLSFTDRQQPRVSPRIILVFIAIAVERSFLAQELPNGRGDWTRLTTFAGTPVDTRMKQATVNLFADMGVQPATLQSGLVAATQSTDFTPPTSVITAPVGGVVSTGAPVTIIGTATDAGGGKVGGVEFSLDGGATWHPARRYDQLECKVVAQRTWFGHNQNPRG